MKSAVVERIKKLLSLATSANEHEARAAAEQAARLLIKHNLKRQDITEKRDYEGREVANWPKATPEYKFVQGIVKTHFFVEIISARRPGSGGTTVHFVGEPENVDVAAYVFDFLLREFRACWDGYRKKTGAMARARQAYYFGLYNGLNEQLSAASRAVETETGLVVMRDPGLRLALRNAFNVKTEASPVRVADQSAVAAGHEHGRSMQIRKGLASASNNSTIMIGN